jgi:transmembrane sensor
MHLTRETAMPNRQTAQELDAAAAAWVAREDNCELSPAEQVELRAWLGADSRHLGAYARMRAVYQRTERAVALGATLL